MTKKLYFIVNPCSSNGSTGKWWPGFTPLLDKAGFNYEWSFTTEPYTAPGLAFRAAQGGYDLVVAVGGDGTAYEVLNGLLHNNQLINPDLTMAILSRGTGCDISRVLGTRGGEDTFIDLLSRGRPVIVDAGRAVFTSYDGDIITRYFLNVAEAGLGGETVARVNRTTKFWGGFASFLWGALASIAAYQNRHLKITLDNGEVHEGLYTLVACGNGKYFGGGMKICPGAVIDDGLLDVVAIEGVSKPELLLNLPRLYQGTHMSHPNTWSRRARRIRLESRDKVLVNLDGEQPGPLTWGGCTRVLA